jgi:hypothetical protein
VGSLDNANPGRPDDDDDDDDDDDEDECKPVWPVILTYRFSYEIRRICVYYSNFSSTGTG